MNILSYNPGHDGAIAYVKEGQLIFSIEAEKNSNYRYSAISAKDIFNVLSELSESPDIICAGGWWPSDHYEFLHGSKFNAGYRGLSEAAKIIENRKFLGRQIRYFSSSHERSHLLCAFGMSPLPKRTPCYALIWEGSIGTFYEISSEFEITILGEVLNQVGNRYSLLYGLADPSFVKDSQWPRMGDAGKLMALASFGTRKIPTSEEKDLLNLLLNSDYKALSSYPQLHKTKYYNVGVENEDFKNFAAMFSDRIFDMFYQFAKKNLRKKKPLLIAGGCGLNCDWNTKWSDTNLFSEIFIPPVANDSGSAIGTALDAQLHFTSNPKVEWDVYSGLHFNNVGTFDSSQYDIYDSDCDMIADLLSNDLILGWVNGKYEIGPRALGNRSILAAPFRQSIRTRLNFIKQREQFRPIAPICLEQDADELFGCNSPSPFMLFTHQVKTDALRAVTHVNGTARLQTVSAQTNYNLFKLLLSFKNRTGYGVLCNTSLNFKNKGFINNIADLSEYAISRSLDGFVVDGKVHLIKSSTLYQDYLKLSSHRGLR